MQLNSLDILVLLKIQAIGERPWNQTLVSFELGIAQSQVNTSLKRVETAHLYSSKTKRHNRHALAEFLIHGVKYAFPAIQKGLTRGIPTAYAAPPLLGEFVLSDNLPPVWPFPEGTVRGFGFEPLDKRAPKAALNDPELYELLVLVDAIRDGRARETEFAIGVLKKRLGVSP